MDSVCPLGVVLTTAYLQGTSIGSFQKSFRETYSSLVGYQGLCCEKIQKATKFSEADSMPLAATGPLAMCTEF